MLLFSRLSVYTYCLVNTLLHLDRTCRYK